MYNGKMVNTRCEIVQIQRAIWIDFFSWIEKELNWLRGPVYYKQNLNRNIEMTFSLSSIRMKKRSVDVPYLHTVIQRRKMRIWNSFWAFLRYFFYTKVNGILWTLNCFRKCETLSSLRTMQTRWCLLSFNNGPKQKETNWVWFTLQKEWVESAKREI